jgi:hypothetical protein
MADIEIYLDTSEFEKFETALFARLRFSRTGDEVGGTLVLPAGLFWGDDNVVLVRRPK